MEQAITATTYQRKNLLASVAGAIALSMVLCSCLGSAADTTATEAASGNSGSSTPTSNSNTPVVTSHALATIQSAGTVVAHVVDMGAGQVTVYIPSVDRYVHKVNLADGQYSSFGFYWTGANCTGTPFVVSFVGEVGKTVLFDSLYSNYYLVTSLYTPGTSLSYQSTSNTGPCSNGSGSLTAYYGYAQVTQTTQPYDFSAIAPLSITYQ